MYESLGPQYIKTTTAVWSDKFLKRVEETLCLHRCLWQPADEGIVKKIYICNTLIIARIDVFEEKLDYYFLK